MKRRRKHLMDFQRAPRRFQAPITSAMIHPEWDEAFALAKKICPGYLDPHELRRVEDRWGGYWQCPTFNGPFLFRCWTRTTPSYQ